MRHGLGLHEGVRHDATEEIGGGRNAKLLRRSADHGVIGDKIHVPGIRPGAVVTAFEVVPLELGHGLCHGDERDPFVSMQKVAPAQDVEDDRAIHEAQLRAP